MKTYRDGLEDAARIADSWSEENFRLAGDTILHDPYLSGRDRTQEGADKSSFMIIEGHGYASSAHTAKNIAAVIRALAQ